MKKSYTIFKIILAFCVLALPSAGQLSGVYTINSAVTTGGTNYQTFNAFRTALVAAGVNGPVTVNVVANSGPYLEQVDFPQVTGTNATNTITINGNGTTISFAAVAASPWTFNLSGMDYMTVNNLNMVGTGATAYVCHLWNGSNNNQFKSCTMTCPAQSTGTTFFPISISGSATTYASALNSGSNNLFDGCTTNWGYMAFAFYGASATPFNTGNQVINCSFKDYLNYGIYHLYCQGTVIKNNVFERMNHTAPGTFYGIALTTGSFGALLDGNRIRHPFGGSPFNTGTAYGIYITVSTTLGNENIVRNNLISDFYGNGQLLGIYSPGYTYNHYYHNTVVIDDPNSNYTGISYGIYVYGNPNNIRNNLVYMRRSGSGTKFGIYVTTITGVTSNYNNVYLPPMGGLSYYGYWNAANRQTLANMQAAASDANSKDQNPYFANPLANNYLPCSNAINDMCVPTTPVTGTDINGLTRSATVPDVGAYEFLNTQCVGTPASNTVTASQGTACPGSLINLGLANPYTTSAISYTWQYSYTSALGIFTVIPGANQPGYTATVNVPTYYSALISCTVAGAVVTAVSAPVYVPPTVIDNIPYYEGFEGIGLTNKLPNCSWLSSSIGGGTAFTYTTSYANNRIPNTGNSFASFYYTPLGTNNFYTNGLQLTAGITYSAGLWYTTDFSGNTNWTELSISVGSSQTSTGMVPIATATPAISGMYKALGNTFTVPTSGIYYLNIKGISGSGTAAQYLSWDDLSVTIPCTIGSPNTPTLNVTAGTNTVCSGSQVVLTATGADTYSWNTGATTAQITENPVVNTNYAVTGTSTLSGCAITATQYIQVMPVPQVVIFTSDPVVCAGTQVQLTAYNALSYVWSSGPNTQFITVTPPATTAYTVIGVNAYGCAGSAVQQVTVNALPTIIPSSSTSLTACNGDMATLSAIGGTAYVWKSSTSPTIYQGQTFTVVINGSAVFTVTGTDANGCTNEQTIVQAANECVGITNIKGSELAVNIYPIPTGGDLTVELKNGLAKQIDVTDVTGRVILSHQSSNDVINLKMGQFANGVYYVKIQSNNTSRVVKVVKQ